MLYLHLQKTKGTAARKVSGWLRNCGLRNLEGPRLAPRDEQPKRIYVVHEVEFGVDVKRRWVGCWTVNGSCYLFATRLFLENAIGTQSWMWFKCEK